MQYTGRLFAVGIVCLFNVFRYIYYHQYLALPFKSNFFILTIFFLCIGWWCGRQYDHAKYYSEKDPLTDTYNRRTVEKKFEKLASGYTRQKKSFGIIMIDLDNFKEINDTYGHHKGDELLVRFSKLLKRSAQTNGFVARWGGDEFIILVPNIVEETGRTFVNNLQKEIQNSFLFESSSIGASVGFVIYPDDGKSFSGLLQEADRTMYKKKELKNN